MNEDLLTQIAHEVVFPLVFDVSYTLTADTNGMDGTARVKPPSEGSFFFAAYLIFVDSFHHVAGICKAIGDAYICNKIEAIPDCIARDQPYGIHCRV